MFSKISSYWFIITMTCIILYLYIHNTILINFFLNNNNNNKNSNNLFVILTASASAPLTVTIWLCLFTFYGQKAQEQNKRQLMKETNKQIAQLRFADPFRPWDLNWRISNQQLNETLSYLLLLNKVCLKCHLK